MKTLDSLSLIGFQSEELHITNGVLLNYWIMDTETEEIPSLKTLFLGKNVELDSDVTKETAFFPKFKGTLYLEDGATMETLVGLFSAGSKYTLSCQRGAVPKSGIPKGVKVKYRD